MGRRQKKLLITISSVLIFSFATYSQVLSKDDSISFKKDLEKLLTKYGLQTAGYQINVQSSNQRGGQTAFTITNNNYNTYITQVPEPVIRIEKLLYENKIIKGQFKTEEGDLIVLPSIQCKYDSLFKTSFILSYQCGIILPNIVFGLNEKSIEYWEVYHTSNSSAVAQSIIYGSPFFLSDKFIGYSFESPKNGEYIFDVYTTQKTYNIFNSISVSK